MLLILFDCLYSQEMVAVSGLYRHKTVGGKRDGATESGYKQECCMKCHKEAFCTTLSSPILLKDISIVCYLPLGLLSGTSVTISVFKTSDMPWPSDAPIPDPISSVDSIIKPLTIFIAATSTSGLTCWLIQWSFITNHPWHISPLSSLLPFLLLHCWGTSCVYQMIKSKSSVNHQSHFCNCTW